jgi:hypothetical protein
MGYYFGIHQSDMIDVTCEIIADVEEKPRLMTSHPNSVRQMLEEREECLSPWHPKVDCRAVG